jgi:hypothetical protein
MSRICPSAIIPALARLPASWWPGGRFFETSRGTTSADLRSIVTSNATAARRKLTADMPIAMAAEIGELVLVEMRKLNARFLRILKAAGEEKDHAIALCAIQGARAIWS